MTKHSFYLLVRKILTLTSIKIMYKSFTITMLYDMYYFISMTAIESQEENQNKYTSECCNACVTIDGM